MGSFSRGFPGVFCRSLWTRPSIVNPGVRVHCVCVMSPATNNQSSINQKPVHAGSSDSVMNLAGEWIGHYRGHFDQVVKIVQKGDDIEAVKVTGDDHVPAGEVTFRANLKTLSGEGQVAEKEFRNPCFVPGKLIIIGNDRISFSWENCGTVEFRKDD